MWVTNLVCLATAADSDGQSIDSTASIVISNTAPVLSNVSITPNSNVTVASTLSCAASESDIDDDAVTLSYTWYNGGQLLGSGQSLTLSSSLAQNGDQIDCIVTATDAHGDTDTAQASVTVDNTPPTMPTVSISPNPATTNDTLVATASGSVDPDGGTVTYSYLWFKMGFKPATPVQRCSAGRLSVETHGWYGSRPLTALATVPMQRRRYRLETPRLSSILPS